MKCTVLVSLLLAACGDSSKGDVSKDWAPNTGPTAHVTGMVFVFGPNGAGLTVEGGVIAVVEDPSVTTTVAGNGTFAFDVPSGGPATFSFTKDGFHLEHSATIEVTAAGIPLLGFQVPVEETYQLLAAVAKITLDETKCQIVTTISASGTEPYGGDGLGVPGSTISIEPAAGDKPTYFAYQNGTIYPDNTLTATSMDGGAIIANADAGGEYVIQGHKAGLSFQAATIRCRAGALANAAPPNGIQQL
ncbi:hypothetical protein BH11MYX1_BH11MYX1_39680 [soil metagenome]